MTYPKSYVYDQLGSKPRGNLYYLKSDADKVIEELKADYKEACDRLQTANLIKDEQLAETRHQKWKRCLAMARWCSERVARIEKDYAFWRHGKDYASNFYKRWKKRWLELAEKFKE
jgi:hypothetical protein